MGRRKAAVLPEPVTAEPTTSFPNKATGMVFLWIGVGLVKERVDRPLRIGRESEKDWKEDDKGVESVSDFEVDLSSDSGAKKAARLEASSGSSTEVSESPSG